MLIHGMSPSSLQSSTLVPILKDKRKSLSLSDNYRAIALSSPICKVGLLDTVILRKYGDFLALVICKTGLKKMVRPMLVHLWSRKPSNIICRTAVKCMVQFWMQRRHLIESTSVNYSER